LSDEQEQEDKPRRQWTDAQRAAHAARRRRPAPDLRVADGTDVQQMAEEAVGEAVANVITLSGFLMPLAPYTAVTLAGVPHPEQAGQWLVKSRAEMAGEVLLEHAKRNKRVLAAIQRFNLMFKNVELIEVAGAVAASVAVDAKLVPADATIALPGGIQMPILAPAIGDTIEYIAAQQEAARAQGIEVPPQSRRTESAAGVGQPEQPWAPEEPSEEQLRQARATRERIAARDAAIANGTDPTLRREGQTIVPGGMEKT
jgi:hypothetical protein